jgi:predicted dehydrogenase
MVKIAQAGVGYWGPNLLRNLVQNKRCMVQGVADLSKERRQFVQNQYPAIQVTDDVDALCIDPEIQALVIATPVQTHFDLAIKALENGKHILVEKPLARSVAEVEAIEQVAKRKNLTVMVGHTFLFNPAVRYVKQLIDSEKLGDLRYIYSQRLNLGRIRSDVDALWNFAPHDISIIQYWLNDPEPVSIVRRGIDYIQPGIEDVVFLNIMYSNKVMANIHVSWLDPTRIRSMVIVGSKKMVIYDDTADNKIAIYDKGIDRKAVLGEHMDFDRQSFATYDYRSGDVFLPKINFQEPLKLEIDHFIDCIQNGTECITGILHAKRVVGILERASAPERTHHMSPSV